MAVSAACTQSFHVLCRLCVCSGIYALTVVCATLMFQDSSDYYLLHLGNAVVVIFMNQEPVRYTQGLYPLCAYAASFIALLFKTTVLHISIASSANVLEQILMHIIMLKTLSTLTDRYLFKSIRFLQVLFFIALPFSLSMAVVGTVALHFGAGDPFGKTLLVYTASHVSGNYLGLYTYYVLRGFNCQHWPPKAYMRDLLIVCGLEVLINAWGEYGDFKQAATVQIYPLLAYIAARYDQCYTALADVLVTSIVLVAVVLQRGPYYTALTANLSVFISLFIVLMYSACLTALLSYFMQQRRAALNNVSRLKDELFLVSSQVSHDVRAPLTHVMAVCENVQTRSHTDADLEEVKFSCQTISDIMDSWLMMLSDSEKAANDTPSQESVIITHYERMTTNETLTVLLRKIEVYGNRVILLSNKPLVLRTEESSTRNQTLQFSNKMLQHVLINLVSNAVKYSEKGAICISAVFHETKQELSIVVRDEGIGISKVHMSRLYDRFYRIKPDKKRPSADTTSTSYGVGLAIVKSLITKMRGSITVTSEIGEGTIFTISIPCHIAPSTGADDVDVENQNIRADTYDIRRLSKVRVLLAEDNKMCSRLYTKQLSDCATVTCIEDGSLVLNAIRECKHDVVLLDGTLPNQTGPQILNALLLELDTLSLVPVVVTISGGDLFSTTDWQPLIVEHCIKPFSKQQLLTAIDAALRRR